MSYTLTTTLATTAITTLLAASANAQEAPPRIDLMTFAQGVLPVAISGSADFRTAMEQAISAIDGNTGKYVMTPRFGGPNDTLEIVYALPAPTQFDSFAVPSVLETPSPSQTFFQSMEVLGSADSVEGPFQPLASGTLTEHEEHGLITALTLDADQPEVRWVKLRLSDGLDVQVDNTFFEFSELIGHGTQSAVPMSTLYSGVWDGRGVDIELEQEGATVAGCYDGMHPLTGTVDGTVLRALGTDEAGIASQFILIASEDGSLRGLRSSNGAPFRTYDGEQSATAPTCLAPETPTLGCGSVVHGIGFDFDSDVLRADAQPIITAMYEGLSAESTAITIVGHSSSEGAEDYNRDLSQRRAASVVEALVALGLNASQMSASGMGEDQPIASNEDEAGRSLNRRVEISCTG